MKKEIWVRQMAEKYDVKGFPDIFFVIDGEKVPAPGRDYNSLKQAIQEVA